MAYGQSKGTSVADVAATSIALTLDNPVAVGDVITLVVGHGGGQTDESTGVSDNLGNSYSPVASSWIVDTNFDQNGKAYLCVVTVAGTPTITAAFGASVMYRGLMVHVNTGRDTTTPLHQNTRQYQASPGTATDGVTSGSVTPTLDNCDVVAFAWNTSNVGNRSAGTGFTKRETIGDGSTTLAGDSESLTQTTAASVAGTFTQASNDAALTWVLVLAPAAGGNTDGTGTATLPMLTASAAGIVGTPAPVRAVWIGSTRYRRRFR